MKRISIVIALLSGLLFQTGLALAADNTSTIIINVGDSTQMTLKSIISKGLPVMCFETVDGEEPTCDYVSAPSGSMGASIANATKVPGRLVVYNKISGKDSLIYDSGDYEKDVSGMTIKIRGNTSAYDDKKPYKIKLQKKFDLLFGGNDSIYKDKEWLLLRDDYLTTTVGFMVNEMVGMPWTPRHHFVNVIINGNYRGAYLLSESVKRNPDCRLDVDKHCGYIFEYDPYWWNEDVYVKSSRHPSYNYTFKYPDSDDITEEQLAYMQTLIPPYETSLKNGTYTDYIDVRSFAGWCLVHDLMATKDAGGTNMYYTKYDTTAESKIVMPLTWDFDMAYRMPSAWSASHTEHFNKLFNSTNRAMTGEFAALWREIRGTFLENAKATMLAFNSSSEGMGLAMSASLDRLVYGRTISVYSRVISFNNWITTRYEWIDNAIMTMNPIGDVNVDAQVNIADVTELINLILTHDTAHDYAADVNEDGSVNIGDVTTLINMLLAH